MEAQGPAGTLRSAARPTSTISREFIRTRDGVEAFLEPRTAVTETTVVLVAADGEWTRRRVDGPDGAAAFAKKHDIPLYEVAGRVSAADAEWTAARRG